MKKKSNTKILHLQNISLCQKQKLQKTHIAMSTEKSNKELNSYGSGITLN